jgi:N-acetylmuramoyl-L-alanine amidase
MRDLKPLLAPSVIAGLALLLGACAEIEGGRAVRNTSRTFTTVVLDAGHGAHDSGARTRKGTLEKDLALDVALRIAPKLRDAGFKTVLTRKRDVFVTLDDRARISNSYENAVFVSIHFNDAGRKQVSGVESYYFSPESKQMAERMVRVLSEVSGAPNRNARVARFRVLRTNENPAVLMECGYITTTREAALIVQPAYREKLARGVAQGIIQQRGGPIISESKL